MFYVDVDFTEEETPRPYYVGMGNSDRVNSLVRDGNDRHREIAEVHGQQRRVMFESESESAAMSEETRFIGSLKTVDGQPGHWGANHVFTSGTRSGISSMFQKRKAIHVKLPYDVHASFRDLATKEGTNMQVVCEALLTA